MKNIIGEKELRDFTMKDVKKAVYLAFKQKQPCYIMLEDIYTDNPCLYFSNHKRWDGGGRITFGCIDGYIGIFEAYIPVSIYEDYESFCDKLYSYIQEKY